MDILLNHSAIVLLNHSNIEISVISSHVYDIDEMIKQAIWFKLMTILNALIKLFELMIIQKLQI